MADESKKDWKKGDRLSAAAVNDLDERISALEGFRGGAGLAVRRGKRGLQITATGAIQIYKGVANGAISPRSGTTPGTGTVTVKHCDDSTISDAGFEDRKSTRLNSSHLG